MSIPGLGQIPAQVSSNCSLLILCHCYSQELLLTVVCSAQPVASSTRTVTLNPAWEWRFQVPVGSSLILKLLSGTAEKDGVELALRNAYTFTGVKSKILTWHGCELEIEGRCDVDSIAEYANPAANPATSHINLHARLQEMRASAAREHREGPRVLITGAPHSGKTTLAKTLTSYATRQGHQIITVNADPSEGMLSLAGTLGAGVFATVMDPEAVDGWGSTPTSGPSPVPVKLPMVYYLGRQSAEEDADLYRELIGRLAGSVSARLSEDEDVRSAGVVVDSMGIEEGSEVGLDLVAHIVDELSGKLGMLLRFAILVEVFPPANHFAAVNVVIVVGSNWVNTELSRRFASERTSLGEQIQVVALDKSDGVVERSEFFIQQCGEAIIKEYFFGDARRNLSPQIQQVDFDSLVIYKVSDGKCLSRLGEIGFTLACHFVNLFHELRNTIANMTYPDRHSRRPAGFGC